MGNVLLDDGLALSIEKISKIYPGVIANNEISMAFYQGEIHGIIGKNGAGKTTLVSILSGVEKPTSGVLRLNKKIYHGFSRKQAKSLGIDIVPQEPEIIPRATIYEYFFLPDYPMTAMRKIDWTKMRRDAQRILDEVGLDYDISMRMEDLSISLQQLMAIIKSFFVTKAQIIILDESSASLSEGDREILFLIIRKKKKKHSIVYISHRTDEIIKICDIVTVLRDGKAVVHEYVSNCNDKRIADFIIGDVKQKVSLGESDYCKNDSEVILELKKLNLFKKFRNINLYVKKGEVLGLAGIRGSGRTEIMKAIAGIDPADSGEVFINGRKANYHLPSDALRGGIVYLPEEREKEGLIDILSVETNITLNLLDRMRNRLNILRVKKLKHESEKIVEKIEIKCSTTSQPVRSLSGGNKQKVVFGKICSICPQVYLFDEPTKGIDISTKEVLLNMIRTEIAKNSAVVVSAPGIEDLIKICDRIVVLFDGRIVEDILRKDFNDKLIYRAMQGVFLNGEKDD